MPALLLAVVLAQAGASLQIQVLHDGIPVAGAEVIVSGRSLESSADGRVAVDVPPGPITVTVVRDGFAPVTTTLTLAAGQSQSLEVELEEELAVEEEVIVTATRTDRRLEDQPLRVEVVPGEEVQEKIMMTPGDVSMLLNETNGLRVQTTSPSLGGAGVRIQGLRGRYSQILADGMPLYGGQTGSIGILQIPPMDLGQVEVIKGVASALYGMSAIGGVVNLVSRRPPKTGREAEVLLNRTSHTGTDIVNWLAAPINERWGYTFVGGAHFQERSDLDDDGWTDLPMYRRAVARPRLFWDNGGGRTLLVAVGAMAEDRRGGTMPGDAAAGRPSVAEQLRTRRFDGGFVARAVTAGGRVVSARASATTQHHHHSFGGGVEDDTHDTQFGEVSMTGAAARQTWVVGAAVQRERFASDDVPRFNYTHVTPGVFAQDEWAAREWLTISGSMRADVHSEYGAFLSPRLSTLVRAGEVWTFRASAGRGYFGPTPFTEETDATGLRPVAPLNDLRAERADSVSGDVTFRRGPLEVTATLFHSRIHDAVSVRERAAAELPLVLVNDTLATRTTGTELIARRHREGFDIIVTHMFLWSTEEDPDHGGRREVPLNPRHSASFDLLREIGPARVGVEMFYTGRQALDDNPYRTRGFGHVLFGGLVDWGLPFGRVFVNVENIGDVRQTREHPLVRPQPDAAGRWTVDAWAPLEGRTINAGVRMRF